MLLFSVLEKHRASCVECFVASHAEYEKRALLMLGGGPGARPVTKSCHSYTVQVAFRIQCKDFANVYNVHLGCKNSLLCASCDHVDG
jgi:hypothetical protein